MPGAPLTMDFQAFYRERVPDLAEPNAKGESVNRCVFHKDTNPSLAINLENGKWKCYTPACPGHKGGGWKLFDKLLKGEGLGATESAVPPIDAGAIEGFHQALLASQLPLDILHKLRGLTDETIARFKLGWDSDRILIPIRGRDGTYVNVRKYKNGAPKDKFVAWGPGYNRERLFPIENLASETLLLCEGELDCMLAVQYGYPAITSTGGASGWQDEFTRLLAGKHVTICYDADKAGREGAVNVANKLLETAASVRILTLPLAGTKEEKDVTDFFVKRKCTKEDFDKLIAEAKPVERLVHADGPGSEVTELHLSRIGEDRYVGKRVRSTVLIAGKDLAPFQVPYKIAFSCAAVGSENKLCDRCGIAKAGGQCMVELPDWSPDLLQMVNVPVEKLQAILGRIAGVPERCPKYRNEVKKYANVESIKAIPEIDFSAEQAEYVIRNLFYLGHGIETNHTYKIEAVVMPEPKTQYATALIYSVAPAQDTIEKFVLDAAMVQALSVFTVESGEVDARAVG